METAVKNLLLPLLRRPSVTPHNAGCLEIITDFLAPQFSCTRLDQGDTANLFATHGSGLPHLCFVGHVDVVPPGDLRDWHSPPFEPVERDGKLYARGVADMKAGVAAMSVALRELVVHHPDHPGTLSLLLTSDEEGDGIHGIRAVLPQLERDGIRISHAVVGEPTAQAQLGDFARIGRRGSLNLTLTIEGRQGHVAYPELCNNPIHGLAAILTDLSRRRWDEGNAHFPPTGCQISNIAAGEGAVNVVPARAEAKINWRYNTEHSAASLQQQSEALIARHCRTLGLRYRCRWQQSGDPFVTTNPALPTALTAAVLTHCAREPVFDTAGGTSDARFLAKHGADTVEFGTLNATIHQINEHIPLADLARLPHIYHDTAVQLWKQLK